MSVIQGYWHIYSKILRFIDEPVLDISAGYGSFCEFLKKNGIKDITTTEYDKQRIEYLKSKGFNAIYLDLDITPLALKKKYNTIILAGTIVHLNSPYPVLLELKKHLNKEGILIISTPNRVDSKYTLFKQKYSFTINSFSDLINLVGDYEILKVWANPPMNMHFLQPITKRFGRYIWFILRYKGREGVKK